MGDFDQFCRNFTVDRSFRGNDAGFQRCLRVVELEGGEALLGRLLEILHQALVAGVVGDDELEVWMRLDQLPLLVEGQIAAMVGKGMDDDRGVLTGLDDLVQVADGADARGGGQRTVEPARAVGVEQVAACLLYTSRCV